MGCVRETHYKLVSNIIEENSGSVLEDGHIGFKETLAGYNNMYMGLFALL